MMRTIIENGVSALAVKDMDGDSGGPRFNPGLGHRCGRPFKDSGGPPPPPEQTLMELQWKTR